ncbi:MAG: hypothetical protein OXB84_08145 [Halobacteriovoraceae bacterium]|nr:hypothetical protein [Halobacteriovoraceae bacterium]
MAKKQAHATPQEIWDLLRELAKSQKETDEQMKETGEQMKQTDRRLDKLAKSIDKANGNFDNKWGQFLENLVKGDLLKLLGERNITVKTIYPRVPVKRNDETTETDIDLMAVNGDEVVVIEVKNDLKKKDVDKHLNILNKFKTYFQDHKNKTIYGGIAYLSCKDDSADYAIDKGLFVIEAVGGRTDVSKITNSPDFKPTAF